MNYHSVRKWAFCGLFLNNYWLLPYLLFAAKQQMERHFNGWYITFGTPLAVPPCCTKCSSPPRRAWRANVSSSCCLIIIVRYLKQRLNDKFTYLLTYLLKVQLPRTRGRPCWTLSVQVPNCCCRCCSVCCRWQRWCGRTWSRDTGCRLQGGKQGDICRRRRRKNERE